MFRPRTLLAAAVLLGVSALAHQVGTATVSKPSQGTTVFDAPVQHAVIALQTLIEQPDDVSLVGAALVH